MIAAQQEVSLLCQDVTILMLCNGAQTKLQGHQLQGHQPTLLLMAGNQPQWHYVFNTIYFHLVRTSSDLRLQLGREVAEGGIRKRVREVETIVKLYKYSVDSATRNRMREKVAASDIFLDRKANYPRRSEIIGSQSRDYGQGQGHSEMVATQC